MLETGANFLLVIIWNVSAPWITITASPGLPSIRMNATAAGFRPADASTWTPGALNPDLLTEKYGKKAGRLWAKSRYRDRQDALTRLSQERIRREQKRGRS